MKQKSRASNNLVTKDYFKKELKKEFKKYPTKADLKRELKRFATKNDHIDENAKKYRDQILNEFDKFVKELRDAHEAREIAALQISELDEKVTKL